MTPAVSIRNVTVRFGDVNALDRLDLEVRAGETLAILGPSGSGKTTLLGTVAGFVAPDSGTIEIGGSDVSRLPPEDRAVSMVFQNYALWPHLTALEIVAYPLQRSGETVSAAQRRAAELLDRVGIGGLGSRYPSELSGGQQQRVGLARALAREPAVYLFDEPTAHLDTALRSVLQEELIDRRRETGAAALYASHDPEEALAVADRVGLMRDGTVVQVGAPRQVYEEPVDTWAAALTGPAGLLEVDVVDGTLRVDGHDVPGARVGGGIAAGSATAVVRPEWASLGGPLTGTVHRVRFSGPRSSVLLDTGIGRVWVDLPDHEALQPGERVGWTLRRAWLTGDRNA